MSRASSSALLPSSDQQPAAMDRPTPPASVDDLGDSKAGVAEHLSDRATSPPTAGDRRRREAPPLIKNMDPEKLRELEKRLVRRIDKHLLGPLVLMYMMNYIDRNNIASARLQGLQKELGLSDTQYLTCVSILFVGYLLMQVPSNLFLNKIGKPALYLPTAMVIWGVISTATSAAQSFGGLIAIRFFLGFVEAAYFPGCLFYLSTWYTRKELGSRTAILYSGSLLSGAFSGLIAAGILNGLNGAKGISAWRWLFIIEGSITIFFALCAYWVLPNFPRTTSWLSEEERELAVWRLDEDIGEDDWVGSEAQHFWPGFKMAVQDVKMWLLLMILLGTVSSGSVTNFFPSVTATVTSSSTTALLLSCPPYVLAVITCYANALHADKTGERYWHVTIPLWVATVAFIIAVTTSSIGPRYFAIMLMVPGVYSSFIVSFAWVSNVMPRPPAKRAVALALINAVSNCSSIYASYMYINPPKYVIAFTVDSLTAFMAIVFATILRFVLVRLNKKLDQGEAIEGTIAVGEAVPEEAAKKGFRFVY